MPYVHLANGGIKQMDAAAMKKAFGDETPLALTEGGKQSMVIGVYPDDVTIEDAEQSESEKSRSSEGHRK